MTEISKARERGALTGLFVGEIRKADDVAKRDGRATLLDADHAHRAKLGESAAHGLDGQPEEIRDIASAHRERDRMIVGFT